MLTFLTIILVIVVILYGIRRLAPYMLNWLLKKQLGKTFNQDSNNTQRQNSSKRTQQKRTKLAPEDIARKKFEKDQGEYVDFNENID